MSAEVTGRRRAGTEIGRLSYPVSGSDHRVVVATPSAEPDLWRSYLEGAARVYGSYGVEAALEADEVHTSLVFVAMTRDGEPVGGMRAQGPYRSAEEAQALRAWDDDARVRALIEERLPLGVVESKGLWVAAGVADRRQVVGCFGRAPVHASMIFGARYALGTTAEHTERLWTSTGAVLVREVPPIGYPDGRYRTRLMFWDRWTWPGGVSEQEKHAIDLETAQLLAARGSSSWAA